MRLKNNKGSAIILTLIVLVVVSLLGAALWQYGINGTIQVAKDVKRKQADYIARSGAAAVAGYIIKSPGNEMKNYIDAVNGKLSEPVNLGDGSFQILVTRNGDKITVKSSATVSGEKSDYSVLLRENVSTGLPSGLFSNVMFSNSKITLNGNVSISEGASIECTGEIEINGHAGPELHENSTKIYPAVIYPDNPSTDAITIDNGNTKTISSDSKYKSIRVKNGGTLHFQMPGHDMTVVIDELDVDGIMTLSGTGRLYLYTKIFNGGGEVNTAAESSTSLLVLMHKDGTYDVSRFKGLLYGPGAKVTLNGGPTFTGAMIAGEIRNVGNPDIVYDADAYGLPPDILDGVVNAESTTDYNIVKWDWE